TRSANRPAPNWPPASLTPTHCPTTRSSTRSSMTTWSRTWAWRNWWPPGTTRPWSAGWSRWWTRRRTSAASTRPDPRSPRATSAATAGCPLRTTGGSRIRHRPARGSPCTTGRGALRTVRTAGLTEHQHRVAGEPVLHRVLVADDVRQGRPGVIARGGHGGLDAGISGGQRFGDAAPAPGAARVEPVQMGDLPVADVRHD